jgi:hypothetical protein
VGGQWRSQGSEKMKLKVRDPNLTTQLSCNLTPKFELAVAVLYLQVVAIAGECQWPILCS